MTSDIKDFTNVNEITYVTKDEQYDLPVCEGYFDNVIIMSNMYVEKYMRALPKHDAEKEVTADTKVVQEYTVIADFKKRKRSEAEEEDGVERERERERQEEREREREEERERERERETERESERERERP